MTTPSEESVRRALAIQMIINREWGLAINEKPLQGSFIIDELTDLVEAAVLAEFDAINERGGGLGAMETGYQRGRIQDESMLYEHRKHDGSMPIVGVNTFRQPDTGDGTPVHVELARATDTEKKSQLDRVRGYQAEHTDAATAAMARLKEATITGENVFAGPDGRGSRLLAGPGHQGLLRGRRAVPAQRMTRDDLGHLYRRGGPADAWSRWSPPSPRPWPRSGPRPSSELPTGAPTHRVSRSLASAEPRTPTVTPSSASFPSS